ncbi:MAG: cobyric acid synthase [Symbiobacteriia bacterium]
MGELILVLGGARSGKSRLGQELAVAAGPDVVYVATGQVTDSEMSARIARHRAERPSTWRTVEEPLALVEAVAAHGQADAVLVDCLTFWLSNRLFAAGCDGTDQVATARVEQDLSADLDRLVGTAAKVRARVVVVSNEVGQGLVPDNPLGRVFRDLQGRANQMVAARADRVYVTWAGIPVAIKGSAAGSRISAGGRVSATGLVGSAIMLQGTSSHVGKSVAAAGLCRIFRQDGLDVAPFKAQNMSNNSYVTPDGREIGRAQGVQALAAGVVPTAEMNPILIKPAADDTSQVVELGQPVAHMSWREYMGPYRPRALTVVEGALRQLQAAHDLLVIEGAGSPAEINLKAGDLVNMHVARLADAPVLLVADIDRGGAFASLVGTLELLDEEERGRVAGFIINKFRGDRSLLQPGLEWLERRTGKRVFGVVPYLPGIGIDEEDAVAVAEDDPAPAAASELDLAVVWLPHMSNFTDLDAFRQDPGTRVRWVRRDGAIGRPDAVILPGTKSTAGDLAYLRETGLAAEIQQVAAAGVPVVGICGGYQMLGLRLLDPEGVESPQAELAGLGLLPVETVFVPEKVTVQTTAVPLPAAPWLANATAGTGGEQAAGEQATAAGGPALSGYQIHMGRTRRLPGALPLLQLARGETDGALAGRVWGTYLHGIFDNHRFRRSWLNSLRAARRLPPLSLDEPPGPSPREQALDRWAAHLRAHLDMAAIYACLGRTPTSPRGGNR